MKTVFLSHITEEGPLAVAMKDALEGAIEDLQVFVSGVDVQAGQSWLFELDDAFKSSAAIVVLCSRHSIERPWLNFESGAGWGRGVEVIPVPYGGLHGGDLPYPLNIFQYLPLGSSVEENGAFIRKLAGSLDLPLKEDPDLDGLARSLSAAAAVAMSAARGKGTRRAALGNQVGIVRTAGQAEWPKPGYGSSIFDLRSDDLDARLEGGWSLVPIEDPEKLRLHNIGEFRGLIIGLPWHAKLERRVIDAIRQWVTEGGRALLLGFEMGDRHHGGNLSELARLFGIGFGTDIVGPKARDEKPYGLAVDFEVGAEGTDPHDLTRGLTRIRLANVQTVRVVPGGAEWLLVGPDNAVFRPGREGATFASDGTLTAGMLTFERNDDAGWCAVGVEAPRGLCGDGAMMALGTWDLLGKQGEFLVNDDNVRLVNRLLDWLSH